METPTYPNVLLYIAGEWRSARNGGTISVVNPATDEEVGTVAKAAVGDLAEAVAAAERGFQVWRKTGAFDRYKVLRRAAEIFRSRAGDVARLLTLEQGKPLAEATAEVVGAADTIDWFAEEARRANGWIIPPRTHGVRQLALREPVGPVAAFTPWNFPVNQVVRKVAAALAAGCSIVVKAAEETPASPAELIRAFADAGVPPGVVNLVYGDPAQVSEYLITHPTIRKVTFTGSTAVGKKLAAMAGMHMKRITMELGGHAPVLVCEDADVSTSAELLGKAKFRNAGQICIAPTRFLVHENVFDQFVDGLTTVAKNQVVGSGLDAATTMGPLANKRRIAAMETLVQDATVRGASLRTGGHRIGNQGNFFEPTVLTNVSAEMRAMNDEPFGPLAVCQPFHDLDDAIAEANRLPYGLAAYAFTGSEERSQAIADRVEAGMITVNHIALGFPEVPFGGIKDSGYGSEGGPEAIQAYLNTKFATFKAY